MIIIDFYSMIKKLSQKYYLNEDVVAKDLIGKVLVTRFDNQLTSGMIVETEAYNGVIDKASHAYNYKRTPRNENMYAPAGTLYVYICYGMHYLLNVVSNKKDIPHAILIRALEPIDGIEIMRARRNNITADYNLCKGPGALSKAMGANINHNGEMLTSKIIWIEDRKIPIDKKNIVATKRIGINTGNDEHLLYRFIMRDNRYVSAKKS